MKAVTIYGSNINNQLSTTNTTVQLIAEEVENDELHSTIENYQDEFRDLVCSLLDVQFENLSKTEQSEVDMFISDVMNEDQGYRGVEEAFVTEESIQRAVESSRSDDNNLNLVQFLQIAFDVEK